MEGTNSSQRIDTAENNNNNSSSIDPSSNTYPSSLPDVEDLEQFLDQPPANAVDDLISDNDESESESSEFDGSDSDTSFESGIGGDVEGQCSSSTGTRSRSNSGRSRSSNSNGWQYKFSHREGRVLIVGNWKKGTLHHRDLVIGPDWPCTIVTYLIIILLAVFVVTLLADDIWELAAYCAVVAVTLYSLSVVFLADPGLLRKYHHARKTNWTYCDHCCSFRMPGTVHCSTCQVCIAGYDHHCPWTGKCIGRGTIIHFKIFAVGMTLVMLGALVLGILNLALPNRLTHTLL